MVDTIVNSILNSPLTISNIISNKHNSQRQQVDCFTTNLPTYSNSDQYVVFDEKFYSYDRTISYTTDSVFKRKQAKLYKSINLSIDNLNKPPTPLNSSSSSANRGITTPFSSCNIDQKYSLVKKVLNFNHKNNFLLILLIL